MRPGIQADAGAVILVGRPTVPEGTRRSGRGFRGAPSQHWIDQVATRASASDGPDPGEREIADPDAPSTTSCSNRDPAR